MSFSPSLFLILFSPSLLPLLPILRLQFLSPFNKFCFLACYFKTIFPPIYLPWSIIPVSCYLLTTKSFFVPTRNMKLESGSFSLKASSSHCLKCRKEMRVSQRKYGISKVDNRVTKKVRGWTSVRVSKASLSRQEGNRSYSSTFEYMLSTKEKFKHARCRVQIQQ